ncbi:glycosyltransferase [Janibacter sp. G56]|uniref:glycosyltransferase n=1 Tax=Janibacter sp. G56 TaxID=3418717 RepID=UPI003CFBE7C8
MTTLLTVLGDDDPFLEVLDALVGQSLHPAHLVVIDRTSSGAAETIVRRHTDLAAAIGRVDVVRGDRTRGFRDDLLTQLDAATGATTPPEGGSPTAPDAADELVWILTSRSAPGPQALSRLVAVLSGSPTVGIVGPKTVHWQARGRLVSLGLASTESGRLVPLIRPGEYDQGQHDDRIDVLAVPVEGMLTRRSVLTALRGHDRAAVGAAADLDLGWRAQEAGHRVVVVPGARLALLPESHHREPTPAMQRSARRVALARGPWWSLPWRALSMLVGSLVGALVLLLLKYPGAARAELAGVGAALTPWKVARARWRSRGQRSVSRRHLESLFVPSGVALRAIVDGLRADSLPEHEVERSDQLTPRGLLGQPALWLVLAATAMSAWAGRGTGGGIFRQIGSGFVGGELLGGRAHARDLVSAWWDGWSGAGFGGAAEQSPALLVVALGAWIADHLPGVTSGSPAGAALAAFVVAALPLAALSAHLSARVITRRAWPRALTALAWVTTGVAGAAVGEGRVGALVALVLLPPVAAGLVRLSRPQGSAAGAAVTAILGAVLAAFVPAGGVVVLLGALIVLVRGPGAARGRALAVLVLLPLLLGPWLADLVAEPRRLLGGWGVTATDAASVPAWQLLLGQPGGAVSFAGWWLVPLLVLGGLAVVGRTRRALSWGAVALALVGLALAVLAPHVVVDHAPEHGADAGAPVTVWTGLPLLLLVLGACAGALLTLDRIAPALSRHPDPRTVAGHVEGVPTGRAPRTRRALHAGGAWLLVGALAIGALGSGVVLALTTFGDELQAWHDPRPAVAIDQAEGPRQNRFLLIDLAPDGVTYRLLGSEPGPLVRDLPRSDAAALDAALADAVAELVGSAEAAGTTTSTELTRLGIGFVAARGDVTTGQEHRLGATPGLGRIGGTDGMAVWTVRSSEGTADPSRLRLVRAGTSVVVPAAGAHGATSTDGTSRGGTLVVAEDAAWAEHARVTAGARVLEADTEWGTPSYVVPRGAKDLTIDLDTTHPFWRAGSGAALVIAAFLAIPTGRRGRNP